MLWRHSLKESGFIQLLVWGQGWNFVHFWLCWCLFFSSQNFHCIILEKPLHSVQSSYLGWDCTFKAMNRVELCLQRWPHWLCVDFHPQNRCSGASKGHSWCLTQKVWSCVVPMSTSSTAVCIQQQCKDCALYRAASVEPHYLLMQAKPEPRMNSRHWTLPCLICRAYCARKSWYRNTGGLLWKAEVLVVILVLSPTLHHRMQSEPTVQKSCL